MPGPCWHRAQAQQSPILVSGQRPLGQRQEALVEGTLPSGSSDQRIFQEAAVSIFLTFREFFFSLQESVAKHDPLPPPDDPHTQSSKASCVWPLSALVGPDAPPWPLDSPARMHPLPRRVGLWVSEPTDILEAQHLGICPKYVLFFLPLQVSSASFKAQPLSHPPPRILTKPMIGLTEAVTKLRNTSSESATDTLLLPWASRCNPMALSLLSSCLGNSVSLMHLSCSSWATFKY